MKITVGIADSHQLIAKALKLLIDSFASFEAIIVASNGVELIQKVSASKIKLEIILLEVKMPVMDGVMTALWLSKNHPDVKLVALSMDDSDEAILSMIKAGCCAYLLKDILPTELNNALNKIYTTGYYNLDNYNVRYRLLTMDSNIKKIIQLSSQEIKFLQFATTDLTYKEIAKTMQLSERTIKGYVESLFEKLNVRSRVGMVMASLRSNILGLESLVKEPELRYEKQSMDLPLAKLSKESVHASVYSPKEIKMGDTLLIQVFAHNAYQSNLAVILKNDNWIFFISLEIT